MAVAARCNVLVLNAFEIACGGMRDIAEVAEGVAPALRSSLATVERMIAATSSGEAADLNNFEIAWAGWSPRLRKFLGYWISAKGIDCADGTQFAPWSVIPIEGTGLFLSPWSPDADARIHARADLGNLTTEKLVIALMEEQRAISTPDGSLARAGVQLTTVELTQIRTEIIHRWPDQIGQKAFY